MKYIIKLTVFTFMVVGFAGGLGGNSFADIPKLTEQLTPQEILAKSDQARGNGPGLKWVIQIISLENGREQTRTMDLKVKGDNSLACFTAPAKVKGRMMLMRDRNMWFIKPGLRKPVPISPRQKLMGGAANADVASTNYAEDYKIEKMSEGIFQDQPCYLFDLTAANKKVTYDKIRYWISKKDHLGVKAEFYTKSGKMFKTATFEYNNMISFKGKQNPFVSKMIIKDAVIKENITILNYSDIAIKKISSATFNLNLIVR